MLHCEYRSSEIEIALGLIQLIQFLEESFWFYSDDGLMTVNPLDATSRDIKYIGASLICQRLKISISGVRGVYGQDLDLHEVDRFSRLFANSIKSGRCVLARDTRPSGRILSQAVAAGLMYQGIDV